MRKLIKVGLFVLLGLLVLAFTLPLFYKSTIIEAIKKQANSAISGKFEFADIGISLFRDFPNLAISIDKPQCTAYVNQDTSLLFSGEEIVVSLNLWKLIMDRQNTEITSFGLIKPIINFIQFDSLNNNGQILKPSSDSEATNTNTSLEISHYYIEEGELNFNDNYNNTFSKLSNLNHSGNIVQTKENISLISNTRIQSINHYSKGIPVIENLSLDSKLNLNYNEQNSKYKIKEAVFNLNNLKLLCNGDIQLLKDSTIMNLAIEAPGNEFKDLFSILPNAFTNDYKSVESGGTFMFKGELNGIYSSLNKFYPNWNLQCSVNNGSLKYPQKKLKIQDVTLDIKSGNTDILGKDAYLNINSFNMNLNNQLLNGSLQLTNLFQNPYIAGTLKGILNLADLSAFYPMSTGTELSGIIKPDIDFNFNQMAIQNNQYSDVKLQGSIVCDEVKYKTLDLPDIKIAQAFINISPELITIKDLNAMLGKSDIKANISWIEPLKYFNLKPKITFKIFSQSNLVDLTEWLTEDNSKQNKSKSAPLSAKDLDGVQVAFESKIDKLIYPDYKINSVNGSGVLIGDQLILNNFTAEVNNNQVQGKGSFNNLAAYMFQDKVLNGNLQLSANIFDADLFLKLDTSIQSNQVATTEAFQIPPEFNFDISFNAKQFIYRPLKMNSLQGKMQILDSEILFQNLNSNAMGGKMYLNGLYSTKEPNNPTFNFKYDLSKVQFSNAFNSILSIKKIAPIMQYIQGFFNSNIIFQGSLDKSLNPVYESINIEGFVETLEGSIKGFKPLDQLASKLNISALKNLDLKNTKNWLTVKNGLVTIKDFNKKIDDIGITIGGNHKINGEMDYNFLFNIPKNKIDGITKAINLDKGLDKLSGILSKYGVNGLNYKSLNILVAMNGNLTNPKFNLKWVNEKGVEQNESTVGSELKNAIKDSLTNRAEQEVDKLKDKVATEINKYEDSLRKKANEKADAYKHEVLDKASKQAQKSIDSNILNKAKDILNNPLDSLKKPGDKVNVDDIKNKMKDWNPFKKEKK